jgi:hypothetical protein
MIHVHTLTQMILIGWMLQMFCLSTTLAVPYTDVQRRHDYSSQTARTWKTALEEQKEDDNTSYEVKHFKNLLMQTDSS